MNEYFENTLRIIENSLQSIDEKVYEKLVCDCENVLKKGGKIIASGLGKNVPICEKFVGTMNSFGLNASFLHSNTAVHGDLGIVKKGDVVIVLSKSGNTRESIELIDHLDCKEPCLWIFTFNKNSKMCQMATNNFCMNLIEEGDLWNIAPNNSTTVFLIVLQALAVELSKRMGVTLQDFGQNHPGGGIGKKLEALNG